MTWCRILLVLSHENDLQSASGITRHSVTQVPPSRATLADVLAAVQTAPMAERRRQDMASAVRAVARVLGRSLAAIPADLRGLNARLKHASPKAIGLTASRWNNARSLLRSALVLIGPMMEGRTVTPVSEAWARFYCLVNVRRDRVRAPNSG